MPRFSGHAKTIGGKYLGEIEASSFEEAEEHFAKIAGVFLCHQCSRTAGEIEIDEIEVEEIKDSE